MSVIYARQDATERLTDPAARRRRWTLAEKLAIVRESFEPGEPVLRVAARHNVNPGQLSHWRTRYRDQIL